LTVQSDLQQAIAASQTAVGCYATMSQATEDPQAKQMYEKMKCEVDNHLQYLEGRLDYLNQHNELN
jgi:rubrerythrin